METPLLNADEAPVGGEFWASPYVNPDPVPAGVNQLWDDRRSEYGAVWGVDANALPMMPGDRLTLLLGDEFNYPEYSRLPEHLTVGSLMYVQADSAYVFSTFGGVLDGHEAEGGAYNNICSGRHEGASLDFEGKDGMVDADDLPLRPGGIVWQ